MDSATVIKKIRQDGWYEVSCKDSHHQFRHPTKKGRVTIVHPKKDIPIGTLKKYEEQSGVKLR